MQSDPVTQPLKADYTSHPPEGWTQKLSWEELHHVFAYKTNHVSIAESWAWRGEILRKHGFALPSPDVFGEDGASHPIYQPWQITREEIISASGKVKAVIYYRRGRRLKPDSPHIQKAREETAKLNQ